MREREKQLSQNWCYILLLLALMVLASCSDGAIQAVVTPEAVRTDQVLRGSVDFSPLSSPEWSAERDQYLETSFGELRIFNASSYEIDLALLRELVEAFGESTQKTLEIRIFNDIFVVPGSDGFDLSNQAGEIGLTVTGDKFV